MLSALKWNLFGNYSQYIRRPELENWLGSWEVRFLILAFLLLMLSLPGLLKILRFEWGKLSRSTKNSLWLLLLLALALRLFLPPAGHRLFYDEDLYLNMGQNIAELGRTQNTLWGETFYGIYKNYSSYLNKEPSGFPFVLSLVFTLFGVGEAQAFLFMKILGGLAVLPVFGIGLLMFGESVGVFAALLFALLPVHIIWSASASSEPTYAFFSALAVFLLLLFSRHRETSVKIALVSTLALAVQCRIEGMLLLIPALAVLIFNRGKLKFSQFLWMGGLLLFLIFPYLLHFNYVKQMDWESETGVKFALRYFALNLPPNLQFFTANRQFPLLYSFLILLGLIYGLKRERLRNTFCLALWSLIFYLPYLFYYAGSYAWGVNVRYAIFITVPLCILAASGLDWLLGRLELIFPTSREEVAQGAPSRATVLILMLIFLQFLPFLNIIRTPYEECWDGRAEHKFLTDFCRTLPENCFIITGTPALVLLTGKGAIETRNFNDETLKWMRNRKAEIYLFEDYWNSYRTNLNRFQRLLSRYDFTLVESQNLNDRTVRIFRLNYPARP